MKKVCSLVKYNIHLSSKASFWSTCKLNTSNKFTKMSDIDWKNNKSLHEFNVTDIDGKQISLNKYKGHPTIVVNVASQCGLTKENYKQLNELYDQFEKQGLRIAAFPCNQFANEEPGCEVDIKEFAKKNNVRFDLYSKVDVNGENAIPLYKWLKNQENLGEIEWNFAKFLIDKNGLFVKRYDPNTEPKLIAPDIESIL